MLGLITPRTATRCGSIGRLHVVRSVMSTQAVIDSPAEEESNMLLILGKPGGGKGTISGKILKDFPKFHHVSTGDLLRQHVREQTKLGKKSEILHG